MCLQFKVKATDQRRDERIGEADVTISVTKDQVPPSFSEGPYTATVSENTPVDGVVIRITAQDPDIQGQLIYEIRGVAPATDFFDIDENSGDIYVLKKLNQETATIYTVRVPRSLAGKGFITKVQSHVQAGKGSGPVEVK